MTNSEALINIFLQAGKSTHIDAETRMFFDAAKASFDTENFIASIHL